MIQIGIPEVLLLAVIVITASNPTSLVAMTRSTIKFFLKLKNDLNAAKTRIEEELNITELKPDIHNEEVLKSIDEKNGKG